MQPKNSYRRELTDDQITHQCNQIHIAERYGYEEEHSIRDLAIELLQGNILPEHPVNVALLKHENVQKIFIKHLEKTLNPLVCGVSRQWRKTQHEDILATLKSLDRGYVRLLSEIPTGGGKSMIIGALVRASLDTMKELGLDQEIHIFTSRIAIAGQLIYEEISEDEEGYNDRPLELGKKGDVRMWCPELSDDQIRLLAGNKGRNLSELEKKSLITVSTYQGLRATRISEYFRKPPFIVICDESHRVTERVAILLEQMKSMTVGLSATVLGPERDPFFFFERIERPELEHGNRKKTYIDHLCYHKSIAEMIKDQELKPLRWICARKIRINVSDAELRSSTKSVYDVFNDASVSRIISKNPELLADVVAEAYLTEHEGLTISGSKPIHQRRGIAFVDRIATAKQCAQLCNDTLPLKLKEKYGEQVYFKAGYVDGNMSESEYNSIISEFRAGIITLLFSAEKIGEGVDFPFVNLIIPLRLLGFGSQWKLVQELGRGIRIDPADQFGDLVVLDLVFVSDRHLLASVLGIFGRSSILSGGLLAGWNTNYELEQKVFELLEKKYTWTQIWNKLTPEERSQFPFIEQKMLEEKMRSQSGDFTSLVKGKSKNIFDVESIQFVEREDIRLALSLGNEEEMLRYTMEVLVSEGYSSADQLRSVHGQSLAQFARRRFGHFRDGVVMVNLNLKENKKELTNASMTAFIELLRKGGFPERRNNTSFEHLLRKPSKSAPSKEVRTPPPHQKKKSETPQKSKLVAEKSTSSNNTDALRASMQNRFGVEPEIANRARDMYRRDPMFIAQATILLPDGLRLTSTIKTSVDEEEAIHSAINELYDTIIEHTEKGYIQLYRGSPLFENHLRIIPLVMHECNFSKPYYTVTERNGIFVVQATMEKYKMKISGTPAVNKRKDVAQQHAEVSLARALMRELVSFAKSADVQISKRHSAMLRDLCKKENMKLTGSERTVQVGEYQIFEKTLRAGIISQTGFGISQDHAQERVAEALYDELTALLSGGQRQN